MSRRTLATVVCGGLVLVLALVLFAWPMPYVVYSPGPTFDVLGKVNGKQVITVSGHATYRDGGALRMLTVSPTGPDEHVPLAAVLVGWASRSQAVYPHDDVYAKTDTTKSVNTQSAQEMTSSQDDAVAAALTELKVPFTDAVKVTAIEPDSAAKGKLKVGDLVTSVNGVSMTGTNAVIKAIRALKPLSQVRLGIRRDGKASTVVLTTLPSTSNKKQSMIGVQISPSYDFPFSVDIHLSDNIGGPSAGMMFAIGIYDLLTPGSLTDGKTVAGTGEIDAAGKVSPIGGIQQKIAAAQSAGARLFLAPASNCNEVRGAHYDHQKMRIVKVSTLDQAIKDITAFTQGKASTLAGCG